MVRGAVTGSLAITEAAGVPSLKAACTCPWATSTAHITGFYCRGGEAVGDGAGEVGFGDRWERQAWVTKEASLAIARGVEAGRGPQVRLWTPLCL